MIKRKVFGVGVAIAIVLSLCACEKKEERKEPIYLVDSSLSPMHDVGKEEFYSCYDYGVNMSACNKEELSDVKKEVKSIREENSNAKYRYSNYKYENENSKKKGTFYSVYDVYYTDNEKIDYLHGTDIVCFYSTNYNDVVDKETVYPEIAEEELVKIAEEFLLSIMDRKTFDNFTYHSESTKLDAKSGDYFMAYVRYIEGYETDENFCIWIDQATKKVRAYNGYNLKKYDSLIDKMEKSKLDVAKENLDRKVKELRHTDSEIYRPIVYQVVTNTSGELFMYLDYIYESERGESRTELYVSIE